MNVRDVLPRDAIPSVDDPVFGEDYDGDPEDELIVLEGEPPRGYPVSYLHFHEVVNDEVPGLTPLGEATPDQPLPVAVTWCPLCGSAVVYDRRLETDAGRVTAEFGVSGKLADDDLVLYDRQTDTEYKQSTGMGIDGQLEGLQLAPVPSSLSTYERFRETHPDGVVLQKPGGTSEAAGPGKEPQQIDYDDAPYEEYFEQEGFGIGALHGEDSRSWDRDDIDPKTVVLALERDGDAVAIPVPRLEDAGGVTVVWVGEQPHIAVATPDGLYAYEAPSGVEDPADVQAEDGVETFEADGTIWNSQTGSSEDGKRQLDRIPVRRLFAFTWQDDHGADTFWSQ